MHRPFWLRALIAIWGIWFTTAVVEPAGLFACEMHGGRTSQSVPAHDPGAHTSSGHANQDVATAAADLHAGHARAASNAPAPSEHHGCCTCIGSCCQSMPVSAPSSAMTLAEQITRDNAVADITTATRAITRRPFNQPFANGPPPRALV